MERAQEYIDKALDLAKLKKSELHPLSQCLYYSNSNMNFSDYKLLQLNKDVENKLKMGETLYINGDPNDIIYICSEDTTYEVINAETSNSLLITNNLVFGEELKDKTGISKAEVEGTFFDYYEVIPCKPKVQKVKLLLEKTVFKGTEHEDSVNQEDLLTFDEVWNKAQISKTELKEVLSTLQVVTIAGKLRLLDFEYHFRVLSYMLNLIEENSWALDEINAEETMQILSDLVPSEVLNCIFDLYTEESKLVDFQQLYTFKETGVCRMCAQALLSTATKFNLKDFMEAWQQSVPEGMKTEECMLYGIALIDRKSTPKVIRAFTEEHLPENVIDRFKKLFEVKDKWTIPEIAPYIEKLCTDKLDVSALLAKYARAFKVDGVKHYCSKHSK